jgi:peptidoglycan/xylan/chitin deacetylase (PgdA/CDA1 family)
VREGASQQPIGARARRLLTLTAFVVLLLPALAACGDEAPDPNEGSQIQWTAGLPGQGAPATAEPATSPADAAVVVTEPAPTEAPPAAPEPTTPPPADPPGAVLSPDELAQYQPNELGMIPIVEYHMFTTDPTEKAQFVRPIEDFRKDLQWFYERGFYVVPLKDVVLNRIAAPAGKRPLVITFDDSHAGQFRFLIGDDGTLTVDPNSAVGVMEEFYTTYPDFGRGGFFGVLPYACFDWTATAAEPDQSALCGEKIDFLLANGYEIGNHTLNHASVQNVDNDTFKAELGGAIEALQAYNPNVEANIFVVPFGMYPAYDTPEGKQQREWMQTGFEYNGRTVQLLGSLMVGAEWAPSPVSVNWDMLWIPRIQACDCADLGGGGYDTWLPTFEALGYMLYVSDGNPDTITVPSQVPAELSGTLDESRLDGKQLIRY